MQGGRAVPWARAAVVLLLLISLAGFAPRGAAAAPYAALVMDTRSGAVYHAENADQRLHPASLTKMMTLYIAFQAAERGEIDLDAAITVSQNAAAEPPSRLGLTPGQRIALRELVAATAVKSANDAATALAEAISGSEEAFVARMNETARALGMTNTSFRNAHGLTAEGHLSTARDMTVLGRHLYFEFPQYFELFSRPSVEIGGSRYAHTNGRFLQGYQGADGIKTGYTSAAGFNLTASAHRGGKRLLVTVFGATSSADRTARVARLMDAGFAAAPEDVAPVPPQGPAPAGPDLFLVRGQGLGDLGTPAGRDGTARFGPASIFALAMRPAAAPAEPEPASPGLAAVPRPRPRGAAEDRLAQADPAPPPPIFLKAGGPGGVGFAAFAN